ncbi:ABC transporter substrate-binding protein [uncultured Flavonifractor sp.]|uniref:ABC transporter substrate-binding protein n=1 Tax=uncultured Flavonifractor sp. TaxID=1193534 RepID=UPI002634D93D|nr:ABC transporter substrate-binding protein [uncultured Flavonifractor sp.]
MKNFKKLALMGLTAVMSLSLLAACGGGNGGSAETPANNTETSAVENSETPAGSTETPATGEFTTVEAGKLHMATNAAFPPYEMTTDDGGFEGIDVEVAQAIADKLGLELVINDMDFSTVVTSVQQGKCDMAMAGLTVNEERLKNVDFTSSYATGIQVIIVKEGSEVTIDNLGDQLIGTQEGTTGWQYCTDDFGADHVQAFTSGAAAVQALVAGSVDCVVIDNEPAKAYVEANPGLTILDTEYAVEDYAIGVSKDNPALREAIDAALVELIEDGTVQTIVDKYITAD